MNLASWLTQTAYVAAEVSKDRYGKPTYSTPAAMAVRVELQSRVVRSPRGEEVVSSHRMWSSSPVSLTDRVWLPGASTADAEASRVPQVVVAVSDKHGARTLYQVDL